jgi:hypothetical protein
LKNVCALLRLFWVLRMYIHTKPSTVDNVMIEEEEKYENDKEDEDEEEALIKKEGFIILFIKLK